MSAVKKKVPELRFPGFEDEWTKRKFSKLFEIGSGKDHKHLADGDIPVYGSGGYMRSVDQYLYDGLSPCIGRKGTIDKPILLSGRFWTVDTLFYTKNFSGITPFFLFLLFQRINWRALNEAGGVPSLSKKIIESIDSIIPTLPEQEKIAAFLSDIDSKIEKVTRKKELLTAYKKGMMQKLFSRELRFKDDNGNEFPAWQEKRGNEIFDSISDKDHNSDLPILAISQEYGAVPRDMIDYKISVTDKSVSTYKVVQVGDFIISLRSFQGGIEYSEYKGICSPAYVILRPKIEVNRTLYKFYLKTERYIKELNRNLEGIRDGKMISYKQFSEISLPYPSIPEQQKIAAFLTDLDTKITAVDSELNQLKEFKRGLLQKMFV